MASRNNKGSYADEVFPDLERKDQKKPGHPQADLAFLVKAIRRRTTDDYFEYVDVVVAAVSFF
jgi:hypothetical protein